uniref:Uncharacterized protein n=1 Tax=Aegilops tauschii subsp. strangulata TaxID=200361 RepID=A0A453BAN7_AEGTS
SPFPSAAPQFCFCFLFLRKSSSDHQPESTEHPHTARSRGIRPAHRPAHSTTSLPLHHVTGEER